MRNKIHIAERIREYFLAWKAKGPEMRLYHIVNFPRGRWQGSGHAIVAARSEVAAIEALQTAVSGMMGTSAIEYLRDPVKEGWTIERCIPPFVFFVAEDSHRRMVALESQK